MPSETGPLNRESWLIFLDSQVLTTFDAETGLTWARKRLLTQIEELEVATWRTKEHGPSPASAKRFLIACGIEFIEFEQYCRDHQLQPWENLRLPFDWFAGWMA